MDIRGYTRRELLDLARKWNLRGRSRMTKEELVAAIETFQAGDPAEGVVGASIQATFHGEARLPALSEEEPSRRGLPRFLHEDRACLLPRGPRTAFAYWEVIENSIGRARSAPGMAQSRLVMRVFRRETGSEKIISTETIRDRQGSWYLHMDRPETEIRVEIGLLSEGGRFFSILSSNRICLPRESPNWEEDDLWMTSRGEYEEVFRLSGGGESAGASPSAGIGEARRFFEVLFSGALQGEREGKC